MRILSLAAVIGITIFVFSIRDKAAELAFYGYPGIFLISILANATVLLPAPGVAVVFAMGGVFNPLAVGLVAGTGSAIGELSGYMAGFSGQAVIERTDLYEKITPWVRKYGGPGILLLSALPNPFFDLAGIAAGGLKMRVQRFLLWCWIGKVIKMLLFAYAGSSTIQTIFS